MPHKPSNIMIIAGEASGDTLGAKLIANFLENNANCHFFGMGGPKMAQAGGEINFDFDVINIIGFTGVIKRLRPILAVLKQIKQLMRSRRPDLVICIDSPGFNLKIAAAAKKQGINVLYYVSPQIWAWKYRRIKKIRRTVSHMMVLYPFEEEIYKKESVPCSYIEHPLVEKTAAHVNGITHTKKAKIALLPGSRAGEIKHHLPILMRASEIILEQFPDTEFILPLAQNIDATNITNRIPSHVSIIKKHHYQELESVTLAIACSGTMTLELGLLVIPHIIIYKTEPLNYFIFKFFVKIKLIGLSNIVAGKMISPELLQQDASAENIAANVRDLICNQDLYQQTKRELKAVRHQFETKLNSPGTSRIIHDLLSNS